jgi:hypothetical protein
MVPDPYKALELSHAASKKDIKVSYRKLALRYHPDRLFARNASELEQKVASEKFASISTAYRLLTDEQRKKQYDHIYKYVGYDEEEPVVNKRPHPSTVPEYGETRQNTKGIGYSVADPLFYMFPKLSQHGRKACAGIQIPSLVHLANPPPGGGLRFAFSSGNFTTDKKTGAKQFVAKTTQFVQGKKYFRVETTTVHPDGRKEIVIEGNDYVKRRWTTPPRKAPPRKMMHSEDDMRSVRYTPEHENDEPWYVSAWNGIRKGLTMCHNPCGGEILVQ